MDPRLQGKGRVTITALAMGLRRGHQDALHSARRAPWGAFHPALEFEDLRGQGITYHFSSLARVSWQPILPRGALEGVQISGEF